LSDKVLSITPHLILSVLLASGDTMPRHWTGASSLVMDFGVSLPFYLIPRLPFLSFFPPHPPLSPPWQSQFSHPRFREYLENSIWGFHVFFFLALWRPRAIGLCSFRGSGSAFDPYVSTCLSFLDLLIVFAPWKGPNIPSTRVPPVSFCPPLERKLGTICRPSEPTGTFS